MKLTIKQQQLQRKNRVRAKISGTSLRPRLSVKITNRHIIAQLVNDESGQTLAHSTTQTMTKKANLSEKAALVGVEIANQAKKHKIKRVVLDRGSKLYHGRLHALADAARKEGLEF